MYEIFFNVKFDIINSHLFFFKKNNNQKLLSYE